MGLVWFPQDLKELDKMLESFIVKNEKSINGVIVPHAGYQFSGDVAGKAFGMIEEVRRAIVFGPSHNIGFRGVRAIEQIKTSLGDVKIIENDFEKIKYDHSVVNQIPFLQKMNSGVEVLPLVVGVINENEADKIVERFKDFDGIFIFSTDLSHFLSYDEAVEVDNKSIESIESLNVSGIDACGRYPLMIMEKLCKLKKWKPKIIEYKNSGDVTGDRGSVVGYASFYF